MKSLILSGVALAALVCATSARADYAFSGSGSSGTLVGPSESWVFDAQGGNTWGSPGVGLGVVPYGEASSAYGMIVTFTGGGPIDPGSITLGNASACVGSTGGGTTFCTISPTDIWQAFLMGPDSIEFLAQSPTYYLTTGQDYFVNVFFDGTTTPTAFTGKWLTSFTPTPVPVPEPASLALLGAGVVALGLTLTQRRRVSSQTA